MIIEIDEIMETMIDGYIFFDIKGKIIKINSSYCKMSGYSREELLNLNISDIEFIESNEEIKVRIEKVLKLGFDRFESIHKRKNGSHYNIEISINKISDTNSNIYLAGTCRDITQRKQTEEKLKISDKIFNHSIDMFCIAGFDGYFKTLNPAWEKTLGWSNEELLKKPWIEFVYSEDKQMSESINSVTVEGKEIYQFENRYVCKNGDIKWLAWTSFSYDEEEIIFGVARDITANKRIEESLRKNEEKYRLLFDNITEAFALHKMIYDEHQKPIDYMFEDVNPYFEKLTGLKKSDILGKRVKEILPETEEYWIETYGKVAKTGESFSFENYSKEIDKYYYCHAFSPKKDFFAVVFLDITEIKLIEKKLEIAKSEAEKSNKAKSEFLSNMSHEIRTPMNGILGFIDLLYDGEKDEEKKELLETVKQCSKQLLDIVNDILSLAKIESGKYVLVENGINLYLLIEKMAKIYKEQAKAKGLDFIFDIDNNIKKEILIDEKSLFQIVNNILSNAIKFTHKGLVILRVNEISENKLEIRVKDSGIGINKEKQKRLFEPFEQGENYLTKHYGGSGLGLSIVKRLVDMLSGEIVVETEEGKGTQVIITIPFKVSEIKIKEKEIEKLESLKIEKKLRIISAEDVEINQKLLEIIFKKKDWEITKVYNGKELIEELKNEDYDIILMDIQMPEMNGFEATKVIRSNKKYDGIPIIGLSAYALEEDIEKALMLGMNDYISKPFKKNALIEKINDWVKENV